MQYSHNIRPGGNSSRDSLDRLIMEPVRVDNIRASQVRRLTYQDSRQDNSGKREYGFITYTTVNDVCDRDGEALAGVAPSDKRRRDIWPEIRLMMDTNQPIQCQTSLPTVAKTAVRKTRCD